jgi:hypothetical protein
MPTTESFEQSYQYFLANEAEITSTYKDKVIVIYIDKILGEYSSVREAYFSAPKDHNIALGSFIIKNLTAEGRAVRIYQSNVHFDH